MYNCNINYILSSEFSASNHTIFTVLSTKKKKKM